MLISPLDIGALVSSRICHDLISPLGAISNGLELLSMTGQPNSPEFQLISDSIETATAKIRFFRLAYGAAAPTASLARPEIVSILHDTYKGTRLDIHWLPQQEIQRHEAKIAFLAVQCIETALPYGGTVEVKLHRRNWRIRATAEKIKTIGEHWQVLTEPGAQPDLSAAQIQFAVLRECTAHRRPALSVELSENHVEMTF